MSFPTHPHQRRRSQRALQLAKLKQIRKIISLLVRRFNSLRRSVVCEISIDSLSLSVPAGFFSPKLFFFHPSMWHVTRERLCGIELQRRRELNFASNDNFPPTAHPDPSVLRWRWKRFKIKKKNWDSVKVKALTALDVVYSDPFSSPFNWLSCERDFYCVTSIPPPNSILIRAEHDCRMCGEGRKMLSRSRRLHHFAISSISSRKRIFYLTRVDARN